MIGGLCLEQQHLSQPVEGGVRLEINEREAAVVRRIFAMSAHGMSLKTIAATPDILPQPKAAGDRREAK